jgi:hypothetical protein
MNMKIMIKFLAGVIMTLLYVIVVPYVTDTYITPFIIENVGDTGIAFIGTETLIQILILLVTIAFILILGGGAILRWFGIIGVLGMIAAYWLLGDVTKATLPVLSIIIVSVALWALRSRNHKKKKSEESK